jgi:hypothetical protein
MGTGVRPLLSRARDSVGLIRDVLDAPLNEFLGMEEYLCGRYDLRFEAKPIDIRLCALEHVLDERPFRYGRGCCINNSDSKVST